MVNVKYANAYKEVLVVIHNLIKEDYEKIPKEYIKYLETNCNNDYEFKYNVSKTFAEQNLLDDTKYILFGLFEKFGATDTQKEQIKDFKTNYSYRLEKEKRVKYNPNDIFKRKNVDADELICNDTSSQNELVKIRKINIFKKIVEKIKIFLHIN